MISATSRKEPYPQEVFMSKRKPPRLTEKREANVTTSYVKALARREEWQAKSSKPVRIYRLEVPDRDHIFVVALDRIQAAGFAAIVLELVSEPTEQPDELIAMKQYRDELDRIISERERLMDSPE